MASAKKVRRKKILKLSTRMLLSKREELLCGRTEAKSLLPTEKLSYGELSAPIGGNGFGLGEGGDCGALNRHFCQTRVSSCAYFCIHKICPHGIINVSFILSLKDIADVFSREVRSSVS